MLRHFRGDPTVERNLFVDALRKTAPAVAEKARQKYIQYQNRRQRVQTAKDKVANSSAHFFVLALEPFIRRLAIDIGYLPGSDEARSDTGFEGSKAASGPDGLVRGTRKSAWDSLEITRYDALFDGRLVFNAIREDLLVFGDSCMTAQFVLHTMARILQSREPLPLEAELFRESLFLWAQAASVDETPPSSFSP